MLCPNCNYELAAGTSFCPECGTRITQSAAPLKVLQGRYELIRKLGQGGMGAVYLAADRRLSTARWAVKELSEEQITTPLERQKAEASFRQEAEMLAALAHPGLPRVTDSFSEDGRTYLVMEFVPGENMASFIQRVGLPRPVSETLGWAAQICDVLTYLHTREPPVIFRDLKPSNIMVLPDGTLKLIDFGIARHFKAGQSRDTQAYGTMGFSSPEQYGRGQTDARSDIYSLSVLLHYVLTGYDPSNTPFRIPPALQVNPELPETLSAVLAQGMHHDPDQRFDGISAFRQALLGSGNLGRAQNVEGSAALVTPKPITSGLATPAEASSPTPGVSTGVALTAMWVGIASVAMMATGTLAVVIGNASGGGAMNNWAGFGALMALLPMLLGPTALILGLVAIFSKATLATTRGRRDAIVGIAASVLTLVLCCVLFAAFPSSQSTPTEGRDLAPSPVALSAGGPE